MKDTKYISVRIRPTEEEPSSGSQGYVRKRFREPEKVLLHVLILGTVEEAGHTDNFPPSSGPPPLLLPRSRQTQEEGLCSRSKSRPKVGETAGFFLGVIVTKRSASAVYTFPVRRHRVPLSL